MSLGGEQVRMVHRRVEQLEVSLRLIVWVDARACVRIHEFAGPDSLFPALRSIKAFDVEPVRAGTDATHAHLVANGRFVLHDIDVRCHFTGPQRRRAVSIVSPIGLFPRH